MKQKDISILLVVVFVSVVLAFFTSKYAISYSSDNTQQVDVVPTISDSFTTPSTQFFNPSSIDPTQLIVIGNANNIQPFNSSSSGQ